jgi:hypothetical protein
MNEVKNIKFFIEKTQLKNLISPDIYLSECNIQSFSDEEINTLSNKSKGIKISKFSLVNQTKIRVSFRPMNKIIKNSDQIIKND